MTWPTYIEYNIGYSKGATQKNGYAWNNYWSCVPSNPPNGTLLFDGFIKIYAQNDTALKCILQEILDTPVSVGGVAANLTPNP